MINKRLKEFLDGKGISYTVLQHQEAFTAQEIAALLHIPGKERVKVVILKGDEKYFMTALPASYRIDMEKLRKALNVEDLRLSTEEEFGKLFLDCEVGAMPPFGNLYDMDTYVDVTLSEGETIVFLAGSHRESIKMRYKDYAEVVKPIMAQFAVKLQR